MTISAPPGWTLRGRMRRLDLAYGLVLALLIAIIAVAATRFVGAGNSVIHRWQPARVAGLALMTDLVNEETGLRGYEITHDTASLQPYRQYLPSEQTDSARLFDLIGQDEQLGRLLAQLRNRTAQWRVNYADPVLASGSLAPAVAADAGRTLFDRIRSAALPLDNALERRVNSAVHDRRLTGIIAAVAIALGLALLFVVALIVRLGLGRWVLGPVATLAGQTRLVAGGDLTREIEPYGPDELVALGTDVEAMRGQLLAELVKAERTAADLRRQGAELERSNSDLQQFAYVASHDLSEPLRKVSNFCQLLERQYGPQLDDRARQYIDFAVDGAKRMQNLINDLLALSRVGRNTESFVPVDLGRVLDQARSTLTDRMASAGAVVRCDDTLPTVDGDPSLLVSLFENLIGNAVKYRRDDVPPVVTITAAATDDGAGWTVRFADNGIGIEPQYAERIFAVFQRLHLRDQYGGTGIGLALCRRIVQFHSGRIELDIDRSGPDRGSTFAVTLPEGSPRAEQAS